MNLLTHRAFSRTGAGDRSDGMEAGDHPDTVTKPHTSKSGRSASKLKRIESDSEDWDKEDIEVHVRFTRGDVGASS